MTWVFQGRHLSQVLHQVAVTVRRNNRHQSGFFFLSLCVFLAGQQVKARAESAALTHGDRHIRATGVACVIQTWKIWVAFKACFNLTGRMYSERWSTASQVRFDQLWYLLWIQGSSSFYGLPSSSGRLCRTGNIHLTMMCLLQASMRSHSHMQGKLGADAPACSFPASALAGKAFKTRRNHIDCSLLISLPRRAFPYVSLHCQNSIEEPWCDILVM